MAKKLGNFKKDLNKLCIIYILFAQPLNIEDLIKRYWEGNREGNAKMQKFKIDKCKMQKLFAYNFDESFQLKILIKRILLVYM